MAVRLITTTAGRMSANTHSMLLYCGKGNNIKYQPYGILPTGDPLALNLSFTDRKVYINPGQFHIYGRQVQLTASTLIADFSLATTWSEAQTAYVTVYAQVNLNDLTNQTATIDFITAKAAFIEFSTRRKQQNLITKTNGIYEAPIARFKYNPLDSNNYFSDYEMLMPLLPGETIGAVENLKGSETIGDKSVSELIQVDSSDGNKVKFLHADYAGHSKTGINFGNVTIPKDLSGVYTMVRKRVGNLSDLLNNKIALYQKCDWSKLQKLIVWMKISDLDTFSAVLTYWHKDTTGSTINPQQKVTYTYTVDKQDIIPFFEKNVTSDTSIILYNVSIYKDGLPFFQTTDNGGKITFTSRQPDPSYTDIDMTLIRYTCYHINFIMTISSNTITSIPLPAMQSGSVYGYDKISLTGNATVYVDYIYKGDVQL